MYKASYRFSLVAFVLLFGWWAATSMAISDTFKPKPSASQKQAILDKKNRDELLKQPACLDKIHIIMKDAEFLIPRNDLTEFILVDHGTVGNIDRRCNLKKLDNVRAIKMANMTIADAKKIKDYKSTYERFRETIDEIGNTENRVILTEGLERLQKGHHLFYVSTPDTIDNFDEEPVVFDCGSVDFDPDTTGLVDNCSASYRIREGIILEYRFLRREYPSQNYIQADKEKRRIFESLIGLGEEK